MCRCHDVLSCRGRNQTVTRRRFLQGATLAAATALGTVPGRGAEPKETPVRVALVFLANSAGREMWPYPDFDGETRHREILRALRSGCPGVEFIPVVVAHPQDAAQAVSLKDSVDGYLLYNVTLDWGLTNPLVQLGRLGKPLLIADEFLGGSGVFLVGASRLGREGIPAALVSTTRLDDLVRVARRFADLKQTDMAPALFAEACWKTYRQTFARNGVERCHEDPRGCCAQSFLPEGYMTTSFGTNVAQKKMVIHQARAVANLDAERGRRTQLVDEVRGDIEKLFYEWDRFGWHRVTVYGDVKEPLIEFGRALGLEVIEEA